MTDLHTDLLARAIRRGVVRYAPLPAHRIPHPSARAAIVQTLPEAHLDEPLLVSDEDHASRPIWLQVAMTAANRLAPWTTRARCGTPSEVEAELQGRFGEVLPVVRIPWPDATSDAALSRFARCGPGAHRLRRRTDGRPGFVLPMDQMAALDVRPPFAPYGGDLYLDADFGVEGIRYGGRWTEPSQPSWEHVKLVFRSSTLGWVTVVDHLCVSHYGIANALALSTRRHLDPEHPLRRFLAPFVYRTATINHRSLQSLMPEGALLHRAGALPWSELRRLYRMAGPEVRYRSLPDDLRDRGLHPDQLSSAEQARLPFPVDGMAFWRCIEDFVQDAMSGSVLLRASLAGRHRRDVEAWWQAMDDAFGQTLPAFDDRSLGQVLTWLIVSVSALHGHVGYVAPYVRDPAFAGARVWRNATRIDAQNVLQLNTIAVATGLAVPGIADDFGHLMPDDHSRRAAGRLRGRLAALDLAIEQRNAERDAPLTSFQPRWVPCSVSR
ncbi:MAG: lipoxygenase family protein [Myxococcota bacterium]